MFLLICLQCSFDVILWTLVHLVGRVLPYLVSEQNVVFSKA